MTSVTLGPLFDKPLHPAPWCNYGLDRGKRSACPRYDYRVTNPFTGPDLVNGGIHRATDVGNASVNHPVLAPVDGLARGLRHTDGALGVEFVLGGTVTLEVWHLNRVELPFTWTPVKRGQRVGVTGATGAPLADGSPMPAHTHIAGKRDGLPFDIEPHLVMPERAALPITIEEETMLPARLMSLTYADLGAGNRRRVDPATTDGSVLTTETERVQVFGVVDRSDAPWQLPSGARGTTWYYIGLGLETWYVATALLPGVRLTPLGATVLPPADCSAQDNKLAAARTAAEGAAQAIAAVQRAVA